ncbi:MAG: phosphoenolpyruvate synthase [Cytophagaceae bacterium]
MSYIIPFSKIGLNDVAKVGGKNASLGEMINILGSKGIKVPDGFATTAEAYWYFLDMNEIRHTLTEILSELDTVNFSNLTDIGRRARSVMQSAEMPVKLTAEIRHAYKELCEKYGATVDVAVRSSATAEDLPTASFAGQHESYLNIFGEDQLILACHNCFVSLFTDRAIKYRHQNGFDHMKVALSVGIQQMVRADLGSSGVIFTIEPESGFKDLILITGSWGLGENIVQGAVNPDEFYVFKPSLRKRLNPVVNMKLGSKEKTMVYSQEKGKNTDNLDTPPEKQKVFCITEEEVKKLGATALAIEEHYKMAMDIEWAKDGKTGELYIVQARPETVHGNQKQGLKNVEYVLKKEGKKILAGKGIGNKIVSGKARVLLSPKESHLIKQGEILVTDITNPDWDPILKKAGAIITNRGGRTSHAAIVAREMGALAVVGTGNATSLIETGDIITIACTDNMNGVVYEGKLEWDEILNDYSSLEVPETKPMFILADPDKAIQLSAVPNAGVGLMRLEFVINNTIKVHPMALVKYNELDEEAKAEIDAHTIGYADKEEYFVKTLSHAVGMTAAAFFPKDVIVRMSDFKTNEYANLVGGKQFEPGEENPMLGFRGASRYYSEYYKEGFGLECKAMKRVRDEMGLTNVKLMIPFCRTVEEGKKVISIMEQYGLVRGKNGLEIYMMVEIPSNVILAEQFSEIFDGFSIGSNDLTQLTLGIDRDSAIVSGLFDENNEAVKYMISRVIKSARKTNTKIGLCGQAPSDWPDFAAFLVSQGIDSISFNPDAMLKGIKNILNAEQVKV